MDEVTGKIIEEVEKVEKKGEADNLIRLSTGVVLRGKVANPVTLITVMASYERPKPPVWFEKKMGREMENPNDPDYISRVRAWEAEQGKAVLTALTLLGTELYSVPKGFPVPYKESKSGELQDGGWLEDYELLKLPMKPQSKKWCYLTWVLTVAAVSVEDTKKIQEVVGRLSGVSAQDVDNAVSFPGSSQISG